MLQYCTLHPLVRGANRTGGCTAYTPLLAYHIIVLVPGPEETRKQGFPEEKKRIYDTVEKKENLGVSERR